MTILLAFAEWLAQQLLAFLYQKGLAAIDQTIEQQAKDTAQGKVNDANDRAYQDAKDRAAKIKAAIDLLNRNNP